MAFYCHLEAYVAIKDLVCNLLGQKLRSIHDKNHFYQKTLGLRLNRRYIIMVKLHTKKRIKIVKLDDDLMNWSDVVDCHNQGSIRYQKIITDMSYYTDSILVQEQ